MNIKGYVQHLETRGYSNGTVVAYRVELATSSSSCANRSFA